MMPIQWLLQSNHPNLSMIRELAAILLEQGNEVHWAALKGLSTELPELDMLDSSKPVVCYGPSFVPRAFSHPVLDPGIFFDPERFRWSVFQSRWPDLMLSDGSLVPAAAVPALIRDRQAFVRPDEDSKSFDGGVFDSQTFTETLDKAVGRGLLKEADSVIVAAPLPIDAEWRTFVVGGDVVAASSYRRNGICDIDLHVPHAVIDMAFEAAEQWSPADVFCLDIGLANGRYGIIEANCFNASRFYGADARAILSGVSADVSARHSAPAP